MSNHLIVFLTNIAGIEHTLILIIYLIIAGLVIYQIVVNKQNGIFTGMLILIFAIIIHELWIATSLATIVFFTHQYASPGVTVFGAFGGLLYIVALLTLAWIVKRYGDN